MSSDPTEPRATMPAPVPDDPARWPAVSLPTELAGRRQRRFQVVMTRASIDAIAAHGRSRPGQEVCGVLVGDVARDDAGPLLRVETIVRGDPAAGSAGQVTFTAETWAHIHAEMDRAHAGRRIVGWYHTHPGHGIFLSGMDLFIHQNFFNLPWQVAYVFDPQRDERGLFVWRDGATAPDEPLVEGGDPAGAPDAARTATAVAAPDDPSADAGEPFWPQAVVLALCGLAFLSWWVVRPDRRAPTAPASTQGSAALHP